MKRQSKRLALSCVHSNVRPFLVHVHPCWYACDCVHVHVHHSAAKQHYSRTARPRGEDAGRDSRCARAASCVRASLSRTINTSAHQSRIVIAMIHHFRSPAQALGLSHQSSVQCRIIRSHAHMDARATRVHAAPDVMSVWLALQCSVTVWRVRVSTRESKSARRKACAPRVMRGALQPAQVS